MKAPYYKVYLNGEPNKDMTDYISKMVYEDCSDKKDSALTITINKEMVERLLDDENISTGAKISFQFGFLGEKQSELHMATIKDIEPKYDTQGVSMVLRCMDKGSSLKKNTNTKIWTNTTTKKIVEEIAKEYGLKLEIEEPNRTWKSLPQGNKSDMEFLKYLAEREDSGNYTVFIRNETLYFVTKGVKEESLQTYTWGESLMRSFSPKYRTSNKKQSGKDTEVTGFDPVAKKMIKETATPRP